MRHTESLFGTMPDGTPVRAHTLENGGMRVTLLEYGGILHSLTVPDRMGVPTEVARGQSALPDYLAGKAFTGAVIGRVANRISGAAFALDGATYPLEKNAGELNIHSGSGRYGWRVFRAEDTSDAASAAVTLSLDDHGEGGMPGSVAFSARFALDARNRLTITYQAIPTRRTPISVTHHAYFNLGGPASEDVQGHVFQVDADFYLPNQPDGLPTGEIRAVEGTRYDLRAPVALSERMEDGRGFDHNFCIRGRGLRRAASVYAPETGIRLRAESDLPGMQLFTPGRAFCLETQHYPNAINEPQFPSNLYDPDHPFRSQTVFAFDTI